VTAPVDQPSGDRTDRRLTWARRLVWVVLLLGIVAFLVEGADEPPDPFLVPDQTGAEAASRPPEAGPLGLDPDTSTTTGAPAPASTVTTGAPSTTTTGPARGPTPAAPVPPTAVAAPAPTPVPSPSVPPAAPTAPSRRPLPGFDEVAFRISGANGVTEGTALLADDGASRSQGLMNQTDLRGYDAMVFRFPSPSRGRFFMRNTLIPLSIAFFDSSGRFVSATDMEPCPDDVDPCPTYGAEAPYVHAIEVAQGDLPRLGIGPGSVLSFP